MAVLNGYRLRQARELKRLTQTELAVAVGIAQPTIARAEQGFLQLSDRLTETIALRTGFPVGWFYSTSKLQIPEGSLLLYRKKSTLKSADRAYLLSLAQLALSMVEYLERRFKRIASTLPLFDDIDFKQAARLTRNALGLDPLGPVPNLIRRLENSGVACIALPCRGLETFDAFSIRLERRPFLFLNPFRPPDRIRLTVSHEIDHLARLTPLYGNLKDVEKEAFRFGAEFLMPAESILKDLKPPVTLSSLAGLKPKWGVAIAALARRARELQLIDENQYKYLNIKINKMGWKVQEPGSNAIEPERPRALRKMFELVYGDDTKAFAADLEAPKALVEAILTAHAGRTDLPPLKRGNRPGVELGTLVEFKKKA